MNSSRQHHIDRLEIHDVAEAVLEENPLAKFVLEVAINVRKVALDEGPYEQEVGSADATEDVALGRFGEIARESLGPAFAERVDIVAYKLGKFSIHRRQ